MSTIQRLHCNYGIIIIITSFCCVVCPVNGQSYISIDRSLLPLENIISSSVNFGFQTSDFINIQNGDPSWCADLSESIIDQYVELRFTEPVVLASLMSGGFVTNFVNNFTLQYSLSEDGDDFQVYGVLQPTQVAMWEWLTNEFYPWNSIPTAWLVLMPMNDHVFFVGLHRPHRADIQYYIRLGEAGSCEEGAIPCQQLHWECLLEDDRVWLQIRTRYCLF